MNRELIYTKFRKKVESDNNYYMHGYTGVVEEVLAYFGMESEPFKGAPQCVHEDNLSKLHKFLINEATNEQLQLVYKIATGNKVVPNINPTGDASGNIFVSMPMNEKKYNFVNEIRNGISTALKNTNNTPYFLDLDHHNDNIYNKMLEEIQNCKFLIADLTGQNQGVYYEAGYAKALGKTVIHTCRKDDFDNIHFDLKQTQIIKWEKEIELTNQLQEHIKALNSGETIK